MSSDEDTNSFTCIQKKKKRKLKKKKNVNAILISWNHGLQKDLALVSVILCSANQDLKIKP